MQRLNLEPGDFCFRIGTIIHEFLHTLGFYHMHSATERDDFVTIMWENIQPGTESNFNTYGPDRITNFGVEYDILSVMHYNAYSATRNGFATIVPHVSFNKNESFHIGTVLFILFLYEFIRITVPCINFPSNYLVISFRIFR